MPIEIIILSGAPRSGKDTSSSYLVEEYGYTNLKFAKPIREAIKAFFGIDENVIDEFKSHKCLSGKTGRDWMIGLSEKVTKPIFGKGYFGILAAQELYKINKETGKNKFVISDAGFDYEVESFIESLEYYYGKANLKILICNIFKSEDHAGLIDYFYRTGLYKNWFIKKMFLQFKNDSRGFILLDNIKPHHVVNDSVKGILYYRIDDIIDFWGKNGKI